MTRIEDPVNYSRYPKRLVRCIDVAMERWSSMLMHQLAEGFVFFLARVASIFRYIINFSLLLFDSFALLLPYFLPKTSKQDLSEFAIQSNSTRKLLTAYSQITSCFAQIRSSLIQIVFYPGPCVLDCVDISAFRKTCCWGKNQKANGVRYNVVRRSCCQCILPFLFCEVQRFLISGMYGPSTSTRTWVPAWREYL